MVWFVLQAYHKIITFITLQISLSTDPDNCYWFGLLLHGTQRPQLTHKSVGETLLGRKFVAS